MGFITGMGGGAWGIVALILALGGTVASLILITPDKMRSKLNGFLRFVHDLFNFKFLFIEKVLQFCYILLTLYVFTEGFFMLFQTTYWGDSLAGQGLLTMILGPIIIRIMYELLMMFVLLIKNVIQINNKLKNQNGKDVKSVFEAQPEFMEQAEEKEAE